MVHIATGIAIPMMFWKNLLTWKNDLGIVSSNEQTNKYFLKDKNVPDTGYRL